MQQTPLPSGSATAIPARFGEQRERVLRIMARWEASLRTASASFPISQDQRFAPLSVRATR